MCNDSKVERSRFSYAWLTLNHRRRTVLAVGMACATALLMECAVTRLTGSNGLTDGGDWLTSAFTFENLSQFYAPSTITSHDTVEFNFGAPAGTYYYKLNNEASYKSFTSTISGGHWVKYWNMNAGNRTFEFYMTSGSLTSKNYTVDFTVTNPPIGTGSPSTATSISAGQTLTGNLAWCYQNDYYSFSATAGAQYTLETSGQLDVMLLVLDASGDTLYTNDDGGVGLNAKVTFTPVATGTYYAIVTAAVVEQGFSGSYSLTLTKGTGSTTPSVTAPAAGTTWQIGTSETITWPAGSFGGGTVSISLYENGTFLQTITSSTSDNGAYAWTVPSTLISGANYSILVTSSNGAISAQSPQFALTAGSPGGTGVTAPTGTTTWETGSSGSVTWNQTLVSGSTVTICLTEDGMVVDTLASGVANSGSYTVTVPSTIQSANDYSVVVVGSTSGSVTSGTFTILVASSNYAITVKLTWNTGVAEPGDTGNEADVDLHVTEPDSNEIYFGNMMGIGSLDVDNTWGYGPEYYTVTAPANGAYRVRVDFYNGYSGLPNTAATVVVTVNGTSRTYGPHTFTADDQDGDTPGAWWNVCTITMPSGALSKTAAASAKKKGLAGAATGSSFSGEVGSGSR